MAGGGGAVEMSVYKSSLSRPNDLGQVSPDCSVLNQDSQKLNTSPYSVLCSYPLQIKQTSPPLPQISRNMKLVNVKLVISLVALLATTGVVAQDCGREGGG